MLIRRATHWLSRRMWLFATVFCLAALVITVWFLITGFSNSAEIIAIGIAATSAIFAAFSSFASLMQAVETQKQRINQERPNVIAHFDAYGGAIDFVVKNYGASPATNIRVSIDPPPIDHVGRPLNEISLLSHPIPFLPHGKSHRKLVDVGPKMLAEDRPKRFDIRVSYDSLDGERYEESFVEDLSYLVQTTLPRKSVEERLSDLTNEVQKISQLLNRVVSFGSIQVETPEQHEERIRKMIDDGEA